MTKTKESIITGFALFSMFFGAGNLILPPYLGKLAGNEWLIVLLGFCITAVVIPILGIYAHAKLQGSMFDFAKLVSRKFSWVYCLIIYLIAISLPLPRTAAVTHEISVLPLINLSSLTTSFLYFGLAFLVVINRSKLLNVLGKYLTPILLLILSITIILGIINGSDPNLPNSTIQGITSGILEGYQTFDAIGAVVSGGILVVSLKLNTSTDYNHNKSIISRAGIIAGLGLIIFYGGLMFIGASYSNQMNEAPTRTELLSQLSQTILGPIANTFLSLLVGLACFTTAVAIIAGTADFVQSCFSNSKLAFQITTVLSCFIGIIIGSFDVHHIITIAIPFLLIAYPVTITLIILNCLPKDFITTPIFRITIGICILFTLADVINHFEISPNLTSIFEYIPFSNNSLGWILPTVVAFVFAALISKRPKHVDQLK